MRENYLFEVSSSLALTTGISKIIHSENKSNLLYPTSTGVNETNKSQTDFNINPNPFSTKATIDIKGYDSGKLVLRIYDVVGQQVQQIKIEGSCGIDRMELESGVYFWEVVDGGEVLGVGKVVVE